MLGIPGEAVGMGDLGGIEYWQLPWQREGSSLCPWMGTLDQVGLTATTPGFLEEGDACDGLFEN